MGSELCKGNQVHRMQVQSIPNRIPQTSSYSFFRSHTNRYCDLTVIALEEHKYLFTLRLEGSSELKVTLPVFSDSVQRAIQNKYSLSISNNTLIDFMNPDASLQAVKNEYTGIEYSMKIIPFRSFNSLAFKQGLEEVWAYRRLANNKELFLPLQEAFVLTTNPNQQVLVLLFAKVISSLLNVGIYRNEAQWNWNLPEKLAIMQQLIEGCLKMQDMQIIHRDLRPGNLLFLQSANRYVISGLYSSREQSQCLQQDLMTVMGVQSYASQPLSGLIRQRSQMGLYKVNDQLYHSLLGIINFLQTKSPIPIPLSDSAPNEILDLKSQIIGRNGLKSILESVRHLLKQVIQAQAPKFEDDIASKLAEEILMNQNRKIGVVNQFRAYQLLGHSKEFSQAAHRMIEQNNINQKPLKNAQLLKQLGEYYEQNGSGGSEYLLNSCSLFCKRTESDLQRGMIDDAQNNLEQAEQLYLQLASLHDFSLNLVEIYRLKSLLSAKKNPKKKDVPFQATGIINKAFKLAAEKNLPIEKQMKLFLTWSIVYQEAGEDVLSEERLKHGLLICQNSAAFSSPSEAALLKGSFYYQRGLLLFSKIQKMHDPRRSQNEQEYSKLDLKGRTEAYLKLAIQIRQRQSSLIFDLIEVHRTLGSLYLLISNYSQAKNHLRKAVIQMKLQTQPISVDLRAGIYYDLGSACYKLRQFGQAKIQYAEAVKVLKQSDDDYWRLCVQGNLALARMQSGQFLAGKEQLERIKELIKARMGVNHFDYQFLDKQGESVKRQMHY